jgi:hypothetical protein
MAAAAKMHPELDARVAAVQQVAGDVVVSEDFQGAWLDGQGSDWWTRSGWRSMSQNRTPNA